VRYHRIKQYNRCVTIGLNSEREFLHTHVIINLVHFCSGEFITFQLFFQQLTMCTLTGTSGYRFVCGLLLFYVCVVILCVCTFLIPCCDVRYDFSIKTMFYSSLPPVVAHVLFTLFFLLAFSGVQHIKNGEYRETANIEYTRRRKIKRKHNTICVGHH
jgi:hypothetical protein